MIAPDELKVLASKSTLAFNNYFKKNKKKLEKMDDEIHFLHEEAVDCTDCLECANCCKSLGPAIYDRDVEKMAKALKMRPSEVVSTYLRVDEDGDYVFQSMPCPFLMPDNYCSIYENRPKACREYPHTDRKKFFQIYKLTVKNTSTCPIAYQVLSKLINL